MPTSVSEEDYASETCAYCGLAIVLFKDGRFWLNGLRCCARCARSGGGKKPRWPIGPFGKARAEA